MSASLLRPSDTVVGISHSGGNKEVIDALTLAREAGATVIAITDYGKSPILRVSDIVLFTASKETIFKRDAIASRIAELAIIDALCAAVAFSRYEQSFESIKKTRAATVSKKYRVKKRKKYESNHSQKTDLVLAVLGTLLDH